MVGVAEVRRRKVGGSSKPRLPRGEPRGSPPGSPPRKGGRPRARRPRHPFLGSTAHRFCGHAARCSTGKATPPKKTEPFFGSPPCRSPRRSAGWCYRWAAPPRKGGKPGPYVAVRKAGRRPGARNQNERCGCPIMHPQNRKIHHCNLNKSIVYFEPRPSSNFFVMLD